MIARGSTIHELLRRLILGSALDAHWAISFPKQLKRWGASEKGGQVWAAWLVSFVSLVLGFPAINCSLSNMDDRALTFPGTSISMGFAVVSPASGRAQFVQVVHIGAVLALTWQTAKLSAD